MDIVAQLLTYWAVVVVGFVAGCFWAGSHREAPADWTERRLS